MSAATQSPTRKTASQLVGDLLTHLVLLDKNVTTLEERLSRAKAMRRYLSEHVLVELVEAEQLNEGCVLPDGTAVTFERVLRCSVTNANKPEAHQWMQDNGYAASLKTRLTVDLPKDHLPLAVAMTQTLEAIPSASVTLSTELPGATLAKIVRDRLAAGEAIPPSIEVFAPLVAKPVVP